MPAISTEDCKRAIVAAWPAEFGAGAEDFKRVSKKGKKGEPIVRVFYHRKLPLQAIVTEENGAIVRTEVKGLGIFDVPDDSPEMDNIFDITDSAEAHEFYGKHDLFKPQDFYFYVSDRPDEFGGDCPHWFVIVPVAYFERAGCQYDQELSALIGRHLPDDCGESSSTNFHSSMTPDELRAELSKRGFQRSEKFDAFMDR
jgi:hypothetical protein